MNIKEASKADISVLLGIIHNSFADVADRFDITIANCPGHPSFFTWGKIESEFERGIKYFLLEEGGQDCGSVAIEDAGAEVCYLERLWVLPGHRRRGFGKALVEHVFEQARQIGKRRVEISVIWEDAELKKWYNKFGFIQKSTKEFDHLPFVVAFMFVEL